MTTYETRVKIATIVNNTLCAASWIMRIAYIIFAIYIGVFYGFLNPSLTRTQIILNNIKPIAVTFVLFLVSSTLHIALDLSYLWPLWGWVWQVHPKNPDRKI